MSKNKYTIINIKLLVIIFLCLKFVSCDKTDPDIENEITLLSTNEIIIDKGFPFLKVMMGSENLRSHIRSHEELDSISSRKVQDANKALLECETAACYANAFKWTEDEIIKTGDYLAELYKDQKSYFEVLVSELREKGSYNLFKESDDVEYINSAWQHAASGMNHVIDIYLKGKRPRYPNIDSISYNVNDPEFITKVENELKKLVVEYGDNTLFFELTLQAALTGLEINGRDEAARYEPLHEGYNDKPYNRINDIEWDLYQYSLILVPGQGPQVEGIALDTLGMKKIHMALEQYEKGMAPYFVVSGGHVHPFKTQYCEAVEMKKYMIENHGIPDEAIFIEPHARHTTTNLRNSSRMIYRFGIPSDKPVLIITDTGQNRYINGRMGDRAYNELGYRPFSNLEKLSDNASIFHPVRISLQADPFDILDP